MDQCTDWQNSLHELSLRKKFLLNSGRWADCKFLVGEEPNQETISGHKLILATSSSVFERMFFGSIPEENDPILITDIQPDVFRSLMEYIYTEEIKITSFDKAWELLYAANKYLMSLCVKQCVEYIKCNILPKNVVKVFERAKHFELSDLKEHCLKIFSTQTYQVFEDTNLMDIDIETLLTILDQKILNINSELYLFNIIQKYTEIRGLNTKLNSDGEMISKIKKAIRKVNFLSLTPKEFADAPAKSELLTDSEKLAILLNISCSNSPKCAMPKGFSLNIRPKFQHTPIENTGEFQKHYYPVNIRQDPKNWDSTGNVMCELRFEVDQDIIIRSTNVHTT